ncbi:MULTISPECIES: ferritin-like domain-containing protein [Chryseobacterium group]|uniref:PA2169 family four-helix-bundle protein n=1 Tax=Chryseobacterium oryzae TaxID=2929799 RepID=A0ABY4BKC2_9FLAO|nr:PA2169 family four-helix-bundle protein [Chryseobacterium oryzae]UOE39642.1 PA2169 family four-helix-bundle protein [Chryseobacterium oryzae]
MNNPTVSTLNDLLQITNDRIEGFNKVEDKVWEKYPNLKSDYNNMVDQSQKMRLELKSLISERNGDADDSTTVAGGLHRTWIDVKNAFSSDNAESTLENVTFGENAAIEAYEKALDSGELCPESSRVVQDQLHSLKASYEKFKNLENRHD